jgi:hypothetical protein
VAEHIDINATQAHAVFSAALSSLSRQSVLSNLQQSSEDTYPQFYRIRNPLFATILELSAGQQPSIGIPLTNDNKCPTDKIKARFCELAALWKKGRRATSFASALAMHPAYQHIIGMGPDVLPLILRELEKDSDHWFWALKAISGADPVLPESRGKMREMADAWLKWGREKGYEW